MKFNTTSKAGLYIVFINVIIGLFLFISLDDSDTAFLLTLISSAISLYLNIYYLRTNKYNKSINLYSFILNLIIISVFMVVKIYMNSYL
jgi:peptidoglycan biosynthesis protein MviN/MurJ (putative lipid II flippase)